LQLPAQQFEPSSKHHPTPRGWQWLFLLEGLPSIALGFSVFLLLPASISSASFLTTAEREGLQAAHAADHAPGPLGSDLRGALVLLRMMASNVRLWGAFLAGGLSSIASHTYLAYTPIIISNLLDGKALSNDMSVAEQGHGGGHKSLLPVALAVVPYTLASVLSYAVAHSAQKRNEHFFHISACLLLGGTILALFPVMTHASVAGGFVSLTLSLALGAAANGPATALVACLCKGPEQVVALPVFSSFAVLGGVAGPLMAGALMNKLVRPLLLGGGSEERVVR